ncbi:Uncharacterized WD repeat-containing protein C17D11.16 [Linum perenne]
MIPTLSWLTKGVAKSIPAVAEPLSREEIEELLKSGSLQAGGESRSEAEDDGNMYVDQLAELDMENYDNEDEVVEIFSSGLGDVYYPKDVDSEEEEDLAIKANDAVIVCARNEDELSHLEVWICEVSDDGDLNMYIHHQVNLSAFPLCVAWLDCPLKGGEKGNFIAVGSMEPAIEIWDLDIINEVQPSAVLGGVAKLLVQAVAWNHHEAQILLSGSFDRSVIMKDGRNPTSRGIRWSVAADVESLAWDPHSSHSFVVSLEDGTVQGFDIRTATCGVTCDLKPSYTIHAHDKAVCTVAYNPSVPNLLATGSTDKTVKVWDILNNQPSCVASNNPKAVRVKEVYSQLASQRMMAIGGSKGRLQVWDTLSDAAVSTRFGDYNNTNTS